MLKTHGLTPMQTTGLKPFAPSLTLSRLNTTPRDKLHLDLMSFQIKLLHPELEPFLAPLDYARGKVSSSYRNKLDRSRGSDHPRVRKRLQTIIYPPAHHPE